MDEGSSVGQGDLDKNGRVKKKQFASQRGRDEKKGGMLSKERAKRSINGPCPREADYELI